MSDKGSDSVDRGGEAQRARLTVIDQWGFDVPWIEKPPVLMLWPDGSVTWASSEQ